MRINKNLGSNCREIQTKVQYFFSCVAQSKNWATVIIYNNQWLFKCQSWKKKHTNTYQLLSTYTKPHADTHTHEQTHFMTVYGFQHAPEYLICKQLYPVISKHVIWRSQKKSLLPSPPYSQICTPVFLWEINIHKHYFPIRIFFFRLQQVHTEILIACSLAAKIYIIKNSSLVQKLNRCYYMCLKGFRKYCIWTLLFMHAYIIVKHSITLWNS